MVVIEASTVGSGTLDPVEANAIRIRVMDDGGEALFTSTGAFSEDPNRSFGPYLIHLADGAVSDVTVEVEILRGLDAAEIHLWSAVSQGISLTAGQTTTVSLELHRGTLDDQDRPALAFQAPPSRLGIGESLQLASSAQGAGAHSPAWGTLTPGLIHITPSGKVTGLSAGAGQVVLAAGSHVVVHDIEVRSVVESIELAPAALTFASLRTGTTVVATVRDFRGQVRPDIQVTWSASPDSVVGVSQEGFAQAWRNGSAQITASVGDASATIPVQVTQVPMEVVFVRSHASIELGSHHQFEAHARDAAGNPVEELQLDWSTSDASVLEVTGSGMVTGHSVGHGTITARAGSLLARAEVQVRFTPPTVGYFRTGTGQGHASQVPPIETAGGVPVHLTSLSMAAIGGLRVLFVDNPDNTGIAADFTAHAADIDAFVRGGGTLVFHDRHVSSAAGYIPGAAGIQFVFAPGEDIDVRDGGTLVTNGPGGTITDTTLDYGYSSRHGWVGVASLPTGGRTILSTGDPSRAVTFSYPLGAGYVVYSSIPLQYYLSSKPSWAPAFHSIYAPNVVAYALNLRGFTPPPPASFAIQELPAAMHFPGAGPPSSSLDTVGSGAGDR